MTQLHPAILLEVACLAQFCYPDAASVEVGLVSDEDEDVYSLAVGRADSEDDYVVVGAPRDGPTEHDADERQRCLRGRDRSRRYREGTRRPHHGKLLDEGYSRDAITVRDHEQDRVSVRKADLVWSKPRTENLFA